MKQRFIPTTKSRKIMDCIAAIAASNGPTVIFSNTIESAIKLHDKLREKYPSCQIVHKDLSDEARAKVLKLFFNGEFRILLTTDIIARGIDTKHVQHVILYDFPRNMIEYLHRIGRTGRANTGGRVTGLFLPCEKSFAEHVHRKYAFEKSKRRFSLQEATA